MEAVLQSFLNGFPVLLMHFSVTLLMLVAGAVIYQMITPYNELDLIRGGNIAAALSFSGALVGLALPLAVCMARSLNLWDIIIWGCLTLFIQLIAYRIGDALLKDLPKRIETGELSAATTIVGIKLSVAMINAAAVAG
jgi:putative membrane protein